MYSNEVFILIVLVGMFVMIGFDLVVIWVVVVVVLMGVGVFLFWCQWLFCYVVVDF